MATLQVTTRESGKSADVNRLRAKGILPMALIEKGKGTLLIQAPQKDVRSTLRSSGGVHVFSISLDKGPDLKVVLKDVQRSVVERDIIHMTLQEVKDDDIIRINVPIHFVGEPESVTKKRSSLMTPMVQLEIFAKPADIPDHIQVDVSGLGDNDKVVLGDIKLPNGVSTHVADDAVVATTFHMRAVSLETTSTTEASTEGGEAGEAAAPAGEAKPEAKPEAKK